MNPASAAAGRFLPEQRPQRVQLLPQKIQKPALNGQVHPTASSKSSRQRIINRIRFLAYPPVTSLDPFGKMAPFFRKLFSRAVTILEMTRASAPEGCFGWLNQSLLS
jgi:hypothetical protein